MGRALRDRDPDRYHLVTIRTEESRFYLRPSKDVNRIIGGVLARYQEIFGITIYAYVFLSNHPHLLVKDPQGNLDEYMENVNREIARRLNFKHQRRGKFWSRRYRDQVILSDQDLEEAFLYVVTNPVKHGLARHPSLWPGLSSYQQNLTGEDLHFKFEHHSAKGDEKKETWHTLTISPMPSVADKSLGDRREILSSKIEARTIELINTRESRGLGFMDPESLRGISPFERPKVSNMTPAGNCYSKDPAIIREYRRIEREKRKNYSLASMKFRLGDLSVVFPAFTFKPPLHRKPRLFPFTPVPEDFFLSKAA